MSTLCTSAFAQSPCGVERRSHQKSEGEIAVGGISVVVQLQSPRDSSISMGDVQEPPSKPPLNVHSC